MPIVIKNYEWHQTEKVITIKLPLKNVHQKDVDLLTSRLYIKASYSPYFFELFLYKPIDITKSSCYIKDDEIIFELCKLESEKWDELELKIDKAEKKKLKEIYLSEIQAANQKAIEDKIHKKGELKRQAVREQIAIDTTSRNTLEELKKSEAQKALEELQLCEAVDSNLPKNKLKEILPAPEPSTSTLFKNKKVTPPHPAPLKKTTQVPQAIPLPRKRQSINISFTDRVFPTPSRESKADEENEWLAKQVEARRIAGFVDEDLRPEERNPQWLQDKGDEFFRAKNYLAAVSAYTSGIKLSKRLVSLYVGRSAAQFELGNFNKCANDCSLAIDLMVPVCESNRSMRAECIARRGSALIKLGLLREGKGELEAALKLEPANEKYKQDLVQAKEMYTKSKED